MFLFRIVGSLIGLALMLLFLPLKLLGIPLHVVTRVLRMILKLIVRNIFVVFALLALLLIVRACSHMDSSLPQLAPAAAPRATPAAGAPALVEPVTKQEDGDSAFATDLYALMNDQERATYSQNFYWAMSNTPTLQIHTWNGGNIAGSLRPNDLFTNKDGAHCRHFSEALKVHTIQQTMSGTACEQGGGAWCKLKPNATPACGLGGNGGGLFDGVTSSLRNLF